MFIAFFIFYGVICMFFLLSNGFYVHIHSISCISCVFPACFAFIASVWWTDCIQIWFWCKIWVTVFQTPSQPRGPWKKRPPIRANTADEAIEKMLEQKKISSKINYDVLKDINVKAGAGPAPKADAQEEPAAAKTLRRNRKPAVSTLNLSTPLSTLGKRSVHDRGMMGWKRSSLFLNVYFGFNMRINVVRGLMLDKNIP